MAQFCPPWWGRAGRVAVRGSASASECHWEMGWPAVPSTEVPLGPGPVRGAPPPASFSPLPKITIPWGLGRVLSCCELGVSLKSLVLSLKFICKCVLCSIMFECLLSA